MLIHLSQIILRLRSPELPRPFRSPLFPIPQLAGMALIALAAFKVFPVQEIRDGAYEYYLYFLAAAVAFSLLYNLVAYRNFGALFRRTPVEEVRRETEAIRHDTA
jgi:amino acid transporter